MKLIDFYSKKRVLVTGHTGFKGSWLCELLLQLGAEVTGFALEPPTDPSLFALTDMDKRVRSVIGDIRDLDALRRCFDEAKPQIVLHLAAQPIVKEGYRDPIGTYFTNVLGTANVLECIRNCGSVVSVLNVTTDKVYAETGKPEGYAEEDRLDGFDPYANSKSCSELVTACYRRSFLSGIPISTARAGNVIGGGDFAANRIIPDCVRALCAGESVVLRNPDSIRPYQHVLDPLLAYLMIAMEQTRQPLLAGSYNVGPDLDGCVTTLALTERFSGCFEAFRYVVKPDGGPHEANFLKLDCTKLKQTFGWSPVISIDQAVEMVAAWTAVWRDHGDIRGVMDRQIADALHAFHR